jgi:hypothetical protein
VRSKGAKAGFVDKIEKAASAAEKKWREEAKREDAAAKSAAPLYAADETGIYKFEETGPRKLANFSAVITADLTKDDGSAETERAFRIEAECGGEKRTFDVSADEFRDLKWHMPKIGPAAIIEPGRGVEDELRHAIQTLSLGKTARQHVFTHVGWRKIGETRVYLHRDGAIAGGPLPEGVTIELPSALADFRLPVPPVGEERVRAIHASLDFLRLTNDSMLPSLMLAAIYRAPLGGADFSVWLYGSTGFFKTAVATLAQAHFGSGYRPQTLPGSWNDTGGALLEKAYLFKDALCVFDDFKPAEA